VPLLLLLLLQVTADSPTNTDSVWDIINLSADAHPIYMHNVDFEVRRMLVGWCCMLMYRITRVVVVVEVGGGMQQASTPECVAK
jgi:hypothetical protein